MVGSGLIDNIANSAHLAGAWAELGNSLYLIQLFLHAFVILSSLSNFAVKPSNSVLSIDK